MYKLLNYNREPFLPPHPQPIKYSDKNNALVKRISGEMIPPPANADEKLSKIILKACAHKSSDRYQSASEMKKDLTALLNKTKSAQSPILQSEQVISSRTNSESVPPAIGIKTAKHGVKPENVEETLPVTPQHSIEKPVVTEPPVQKVQPSNQTPQAYVFGGQPNIPNQQQRYRAPQAVFNNQQQYRVPQTGSTNQQNQVTDATKKNNRTTGNILGWIGFGVTFILMFVLAPYTIVQTIGILITQILFTIKKDSKAAAIIMMICSIFSFAVLNFIVSISYLRLCNSKEIQR